ncbi:protein Bouncer [Fundulus heteroclitus]|uniref:protein Bouncer n=1 Tax=Fundulus heteroclitus TaxID=8078 RepID=UPI00165C643D|nr:protein Bouncer [Fundulus heteroclitus]
MLKLHSADGFYETQSGVVRSSRNRAAGTKLLEPSSWKSFISPSKTQKLSVMSKLPCLLLLLCLPPAVVSLFCYTCVFPAISPLDCIRFPLKCPPGQLCLSSRAEGQRGDFRVVLYEKSCVLPALCGVTGEKYALGLNFTFTNECCNTHLCNTAASFSPRPLWTALVLPLLAVCSAR